jgi:hypothetical protein
LTLIGHLLHLALAVLVYVEHFLWILQRLHAIWHKLVLLGLILPLLLSSVDHFMHQSFAGPSSLNSKRTSVHNHLSRHFPHLCRIYHRLGHRFGLSGSQTCCYDCGIFYSVGSNAYVVDKGL